MSNNYLRQKEIEAAQNYLRQLENQVEKAHVNVDQRQDLSVHIEVDNSVAPGQFKPHPSLQGYWYASRQTFQAMKKDIFSIGDDIDEFSEVIICEDCKSEVDKQFWHHCPYCETKFPT
jgi:uncharacterized CHY-type Zn-finger protein